MPLSEAQLRPYSQNIRLKENFEPTTPTPFNTSFSSIINVIENQVCAVKNISCVEFQIFMKISARILVSCEKVFFQEKGKSFFQI